MRVLLLVSGLALVVGALAARGFAADVGRGLAIRLTEKGDPEAAHVWLDRVGWIDGETEGHRWIRGDAFLAQGDPAAALAAYDSVLDDPEDPNGWGGAWTQRADLALTLGADTTGMAADLDQGLRVCRTPYTRITRAFYRTHAGQHQRALDEFNEAEKLIGTPDRTDAQMYVERGRTHARLGHDAEAAADLATAVRLGPDWGYAHRTRSRYHASREEWTQADESSRALADLFPESPLDQRGAAGGAYCAGDADGVRLYIDRFLAVGGDIDDVYEGVRAVYEGGTLKGGACDGLFDLDRIDV